ncbi:GNAT family N-acetyltransferase [Chamaesiphon sp. OTE_8_metabat_110]|uniref:GNAT family N-acetyltransferase n=1 Tax=Chamaesiphon sp. OTE_8_metabat_110 TaxID=2964696 RepID=UPI0037C0C675
MSSSRSNNNLPLGYSLRVATQQDLGRILFFCWNSYLGIITLVLVIVVPMMLWQLLHKFSVLNFVVFLYLFVILSFLFYALLSGYFNHKNWVNHESCSAFLVEHRNEICGYMNYENLSTHTFLHLLFVDKKEQRRGIGSFLTSYCMNNARKPIYLVCYSQSNNNFYYNWGFVNADYSNIPRELYRYRQKQHLQIMVFNETNE